MFSNRFLLLIGFVTFQFSIAIAQGDSDQLKIECAAKYLRELGKVHTKFSLYDNSLRNDQCRGIVENLKSDVTKKLSYTMTAKFRFLDNTTKCVLDACTMNQVTDAYLKFYVYNSKNVTDSERKECGAEYLKLLFASFKTCSGALEKFHEYLLQKSFDLRVYKNAREDGRIGFCERKYVIDSQVVAPRTAKILQMNQSPSANINCTDITRVILREEKVFYFTEISNEVLTFGASENQWKCFNDKLNKSNFFARALAVKQLKELRLGEEQIQAEKKRFGEASVDCSFIECIK